MFKIIRIDIYALLPDNEPVYLKSFSSLSAADDYLSDVNGVRIQFQVFWEDGTSQIGRVKSKSLQVWFADWIHRIREIPNLPCSGKLRLISHIENLGHKYQVD